MDLEAAWNEMYVFHAPLEATGTRFCKAISIFNCNLCTSSLPLTSRAGCKLAQRNALLSPGRQLQRP